MFIIRAHRIVQTLKILTGISFLFVEVRNEKFIAPIVLWIYGCIIGIAGISGIILYSFVLFNLLYLFLSASKHNKLNDCLSLIAICVFYIPLAFTIKYTVTHYSLVCWLTHLVFLITSLFTASFIINRLKQQDYRLT